MIVESVSPGYLYFQIYCAPRQRGDTLQRGRGNPIFRIPDLSARRGQSINTNLNTSLYVGSADAVRPLNWRRAGAGGAGREQRMPYGERSMVKTAGRGRAGWAVWPGLPFSVLRYLWAPKKKKFLSILAGLSLLI